MNDYFGSSGYIINKTRLSFEPNMLACLRCWLCYDSWAKI